MIDRFGSESVLPQRTPHQFFDVTFNANGGTVSPVSAQSGVDGKLESLPTPTRDGYRFDGWFTALSGGTQVTTDTVFGANTTIYAQWTYTGGGPFIALQSISLNKTTLTLSPGGSAALTVIYDPANTTENPAAAWTSSNPNVATVAGGVVTAKAAGEATVTASVTAANGTKIATCKVSVTPGGEPFTQTPVAHDKIPAAKTPTAPGGSSKLPMTITFPDGKSANVTWTVGAAGDTGKASVDSKGNVTGVSEGKVTLVAKATDGSGKTHKVTIIIAKDVTKVRTPLAKIYLAKGKAWTPAVCADSVNPKTKEADTSAKLTWKSSNPAVAAVNETTGKITPKKPGKATITATSLNGKSKLTIAVTVATKATALKKFALSGAPKSLKAGKTAQLKLKLTPSKATNPAVKFKSSAPKVVSVDKAGKLTALKKGKAQITVTAGKKKVTKTVTVK
ncbi:MAG: Ig-like domain-containing protein [Clostridiales Family XIII bacterium]|nr:Ig-like domain-containing protein [Clostridiales Family XIII bacterium]